MATLGILDLLEHCGFDRSVPTKLVRHQDPSRYDVDELLRIGLLDTYQGFQGRPIFDACDQIVSFLGAGRTRARFIGVYQVLDRKAAREVRLSEDFPFPEWKADSKYFYQLQRVEGYEDLEHRVVIEWGRATRSWVQRLRNKEVVELLPKGRIRDPFTDYLEFTLTHDELVSMFNDPEANREWRARLSAVAGVYLVVASKTGAQYVGSAHGATGIWGRWEDYARTGHGGNALLKRMVAEDPDYPRAFQYTILQVLPKTTTRRDVYAWERRYKHKLGTRATGLNIN